jgi:hypothetical protein
MHNLSGQTLIYAHHKIVDFRLDRCAPPNAVHKASFMVLTEQYELWSPVIIESNDSI